MHRSLHDYYRSISPEVVLTVDIMTPFPLGWSSNSKKNGATANVTIAPILMMTESGFGLLLLPMLAHNTKVVPKTINCTMNISHFMIP
jgi:hypothetical protein